LLVAPASLLANWASEIERFAPGFKALIAHPSALPATELKNVDADRLQGVDLADHQLWFAAAHWRGSRISIGVWRCSMKRRRSRIPLPNRRKRREETEPRARLALTGTPVENRLGDLWSIFDFINPGLLGNPRSNLRLFAKSLAAKALMHLMDPFANWCGPIFSPAEDRQDRDLGSAG
jgi:hypothetical protein